MIKQSLKYIKRNLSKVILIFLLFIVIGVTAFGTLYLTKSNDLIKNKLTEGYKYTVKLDGRLFKTENYRVIFRDNAYKNEINDAYNLLLDILKDERIKNSSYNLTVNAPVFEEVETYNQELDIHGVMFNYLNNYLLYGVDTNFFKNNEIEIIEGRGFSEDDIGKNYIIVHENKISPSDSNKKIAVGDKIPAYYYSGGYGWSNFISLAPEFEVIGKYKHKEVRQNEINGLDYRLNDRYYILNEDLLSYVNNNFKAIDDFFGYGKEALRFAYEILDISMNFRILNAYLETDSIDDVESLKLDIDKRLFDYNFNYDNRNDVEIPDDPENENHAVTITSLDKIYKVLRPMESLLKNINSSIIFILLFLVFIMFMLLSIIFRGRIREFAIKEALGASLNDIALENIFMTSFVGIFGLVLSIPIVTFGFKDVLRSMLTDSLLLQNELARIETGILDAYKEIDINTINELNVHFSIIEILIVVSIVILISSLITLLSLKVIKKKSIKDLLVL